MGTRDGSIIATIITTHMPRNDAAARGHVCPGIRIHAIDIVLKILRDFGECMDASEERQIVRRDPPQHEASRLQPVCAVRQGHCEDAFMSLALQGRSRSRDR